MFADVDPDSELGQEEVFGPVLAVIPFSDNDEALRIANGTPYGLSGAVWAGDDETAVDFARRVQTGQLDISGGKYNPAAPFGGYKEVGHRTRTRPNRLRGVPPDQVPADELMTLRIERSGPTQVDHQPARVGNAITDTGLIAAVEAAVDAANSDTTVRPRF